MKHIKYACLGAFVICLACSVRLPTHPMLVLSNTIGPGPVNVGSVTFACKLAPSVVAVYEQNVWVGSVVVVSRHTVLTAYHVVDGDPVFSIRAHYCKDDGISESDAYPATLIAAQPDADIALLGVTRVLRDGIRVMPIRAGEPVWIYSSARWGASGIVARRDAHHALVDGLVKSGDSGGAVLDAKGDLVGIILARMTQSRQYVMRLPSM